MIIKHFTEEDVDYVMNNLWSRGQEEILIMGSTVEKTREKFKSMVEKPWSTGFYKDDKCFAMVIMEPISNMKWKTSFVAVEEGFKAHWFGLTKHLRKASDFIVNNLSGYKGEIELETSSDSDYNWFTALGFTLMGTDGFIDKYVKKAA